MKGARFANIIAVWNWWYKSISMLFFSQYFLENMFYWNGSIDIWNYYMKSSSIFKQKKQSLSVLRLLKFLDTTPNWKYKVATLRIVTIKNLELASFFYFDLMVSVRYRINWCKCSKIKRLLKKSKKHFITKRFFQLAITIVSFWQGTLQHH